MKTNRIIAEYLSCSHFNRVNAFHDMNRERAAYLLRAGRSRSRGNVQRLMRGQYLIKDCNSLVTIKRTINP